MNKTELIKAIASEVSVSQKVVGQVLETFTQTVRTTLQKGDKVKILGFGTWHILANY